MSRRRRTRIGQLVEKLADELNPNKWAGIAQLREMVKASGLLKPDDVALQGEMWEWFVGEVIRKAMRRKDEDGYPLFPSLVVPIGDTGKTERRYMRERGMKPIHYRQYYDQWDAHEDYCRKMKNATARRCIRRYDAAGQMFFSDWIDPEPEAGAA